MIRPSLTIALLLATGAALAAAGRPLEAQKRQRDVITRAELEEIAQKSTDLYQAIRSLRPHFLAPPRGVRSLGSSPPAATVVYIDGNRAGEITGLRTVMTVNVEEVRYLEPSRAQDEYGITHSGGAILVKLYKGPPPPPPPSEGR